MKVLSIRTTARNEFIDVTNRIQQCIEEEGLKDGIVCIFVPHTTAGITINEDADPDVTYDVQNVLSQLVPRHASYRHSEGNSDSHTKSSIIGASLTVIVENGKLQLGTWQGIYFAEFDGPRSRQCWVKIIPS